MMAGPNAATFDLEPCSSLRSRSSWAMRTSEREAASCPFHDLAEQDRDLVCNMNERLPGQCCVRIQAPARRDAPAPDADDPPR